MFKTIVHHTAKNKGEAFQIEESAPFKCTQSDLSYLGSGYYFWDNHFELAHWWGKVHYNREYVICEGNFEIQDIDFLDLVGSRSDMIHLSELIQKFSLTNQTMGTVIEKLKKLNELPSFRGIFSFLAIRSIEIKGDRNDSYLNKAQLIKYTSNNVAFTNLSPRLIICMVNKNRVILPSLKVVYPENY